MIFTGSHPLRSTGPLSDSPYLSVAGCVPRTSLSQEVIQCTLLLITSSDPIMAHKGLYDKCILPPTSNQFRPYRVRMIRIPTSRKPYCTRNITNNVNCLPNEYLFALRGSNSFYWGVSKLAPMFKQRQTEFDSGQEN